MNTMIYHMMDLMMQDLKRKMEGPICVIPLTRGKVK